MTTQGAPTETTRPAAPAEQPLSVTFRRYGQILLKRKWLILGVLAIVMAGASLFTFRQMRIYQAKLTVIVDVSAPQVLGGEAEALTGLPFLGILPSIEQNQGGAAARPGNGVVDPRKGLYLHTNPKSSVAECARSIRTNLLFMSPEKALATLLVTSPGPREGKTTTAISLAIAMAQGGQRVLLVDTDLRRPRIHRAFGVSGEVGVTGVMLGQSTLEEAVKTTEVPNLFVLPCGPLPPNPAELLHTDRFGALMAEMRERYDRVILDSPPVVAVTHAAVLGARVDGVLLVVKAGQTPREGLRRSARVLADVGARVLGCILNDLDLTSRAYGQCYYYYYRKYGYGYWYGQHAHGEAAQPPAATS